MKLELKHLASFLPYELRGIFTIYNTEQTVRSLSVIYINRELEYRHFKPILRPLSDLTKDDKFSELINEELICGAWKFVHDDWTTSIQTSNNQHTLLIIQNEVAPECTVLFFNYMIENHYDVFGLIEKGLAIDINTIEP